MINFDHWARVEVGLDGTPSLCISFNALKRKNQINTQHKVNMQNILK